MTKSILLPIDLSQVTSWKQALPVAVKLAGDSDENNVDLHMLCVVPDFGMSLVGSFFPPDHTQNTMREMEGLVSKFVADNIPGDLPAGVKVTTHIRSGTIYKEILAVADELGCNLIVMASHRPETKDYLLGPNAARVVRHAKQSVYVVRG